MRKFYILMAFALIATFVKAEQIVVTVESSGQLASKIPAESKYTITDLKIIGNLNLADFIFLREMCGVDANMNETAGVLRILDLSEANVRPSNYEYDEFGHPLRQIGEPEYYRWRQPDELASYYLWDGNYMMGYLAPDAFGYNLFAGCKSLEEITIPNTLKGCRNLPFDGCENLKAIKTADNRSFLSYDGVLYGTYDPVGIPWGKEGTLTVPKSMNKWYNNLNGWFHHCKKLTAFKVEEGNETFYAVDGVLYSKWIDKTVLVAVPCAAEGSFNVADDVTEIGNWAFANCSKITSVNIPESVKTLGYCIFCNNSSLKTIHLPSNITKIESSMFQGCTSLERIELPDKVYRIESCAFQDCSSLQEINLGFVESIGECAFAGCSSLSSLSLSSAANDLGECAFRKTELKEMVLPKRMTEISGGLFYDCDKLTKVVIGNKIEKVHTYAFKNCSALRDIYMSSDTPPVCDKDEFSGETTYDYIFGNVDRASCVLHVPTGSQSDYAVADGWRAFLNISEYDVTGIQNVQIQDSAPVYYSISGIKGRTKGLNIVTATGKKAKKIIMQ